MNFISPLALINGRICEISSGDQLKTSINQLFDVDVNSVANGDVLIYDSINRIWRNEKFPEVIRNQTDEISNEIFNSTISEVDFVRVDDVNIVKWLYSVSLISNPRNKEVGEITATHNGTLLLDATEVSFSKFSMFSTGSGIPNLDVEVFLTGSSSDQKMSLIISNSDPVDIRSLRIHIDSKKTNSRWIDGEFADNTPYTPRRYDAGGA